MAKILIVDDRERNLLALQKVLAGLHVEIVEALDGEQALYACLHHDFALAILDVKMPGMDGYELADLMRGDTRTRSIPIIFMSAVYADDPNIFKGYLSGGVDFITKPFHPDILVSKVKIFLELDAGKQELIEQKKILETTVKKLEQEMAARKEIESKLMHSNEELQQFAYVASHDLQAPIRSIIGFLDLLEGRYGDRLDDDGRHYIQRSRNAGHRMKALIKDVLTMSKINSNKAAITKTDMNQIIEEVRDNLQSVLLEKDPEIILSPLPTLDIDAGQIRSLFQNLLANGLKYNRSPKPRIEIGCCHHDKVYRFHVKDNGIGIAPQYQERIFLLFQRLHTQQEYSGTGLGLALCKKIVERHGGTLWVESTPGSGSTFYFTLTGS